MCAKHRNPTHDELRRDESGTLMPRHCVRIALGYPAPYKVGSASLGFQTLYRLWNHHPLVSCERFFFGDLRQPTSVTLETRTPPSALDALAFSVSCETELLPVVAMLSHLGLAPLRRDRPDDAIPVIIGGPLTYLSPHLVAPIADAVVHGEAEEAAGPIADALARHPSHLGRTDKAAFLDALPPAFGIWVPARTDVPPPPHIVPATALPAVAATWSPHAELRDLFLVEIARGCPRGCAFCVMSRTAQGTGPFRAVNPDTVLAAIPGAAPGVGLVGAAVTDHPHLLDIVVPLVNRGQRVSLSSMRADRISEPLLNALVRSGLRTLTVAADGASERLRREINKGITRAHLVEAATLARHQGLAGMKLYSMLGLPGETDDDIAEFAALALHLHAVLRLTLGVQPFVPKPRTPLADVPMVPVTELDRRFALLRRFLKGRVPLSPVSPKWAWIDWKLAHGHTASACAACHALEGGGNFAAWRRALDACGL
ncbi:MAG: B12-binding domain-containing radical SAM protein [Proteobacteria bacterium]|nr:B12-binding domain-containing radical SAM protein [Pseudomonadota bacterium]